MLWRVFAYCSPGFPRPTTIFTTPPGSRRRPLGRPLEAGPPGRREGRDHDDPALRDGSAGARTSPSRRWSPRRAGRARWRAPVPCTSWRSRTPARDPAPRPGRPPPCSGSRRIRERDRLTGDTLAEAVEQSLRDRRLVAYSGPPPLADPAPPAHAERSKEEARRLPSRPAPGSPGRLIRPARKPASAPGTAGRRMRAAAERDSPASRRPLAPPARAIPSNPLAAAAVLPRLSCVLLGARTRELRRDLSHGWPGPGSPSRGAAVPGFRA